MRTESPSIDRSDSASRVLEDMQVAVIGAGLPEQEKRRREEMRFIHNFGTLAPGGLNQDYKLQ